MRSIHFTKACIIGVGRFFKNVVKIAATKDTSFVSYVIVSLLTLIIIFRCWMGNSSSNMAAPVVVNATTKHTASVIFLHGLGDTGHGWSEAFAMIKQPHIRYVCPTANAIPVTLNGGMRMPSWFDVYGLDMKSREDTDGIKAAAEILQRYITEEEKKGIPRNRIIVGGFSQGGAVALYSALTFDKPSLAGIIGLSTWLPLAKTFPQAAKANKDTPIFQAHGLADPIVNYNFGKMTSEVIKSFNSKLEFKSYEDMGHSSCQQEMDDVKKFIDTHLPPLASE